MKQRLCIGIQCLNSEWESIFHQIGIWFEEVNFSLELTQSYSVILINKKPDANQIKTLRNYLNDGGVILELHDSHVFFDKSEFSSLNAKTILNDSKNDAFQHIPFIDINAEIRINKQSSLFDGLIHLKPFGNGTLGFFGANLPCVLNSEKFSRKRFFSKNGKYPDEIVNKVSKHKLLEVFTATLKQLYFLRNLPFIQKWNSPSHKPVFCFRIDSDFGNQESVDNLQEVLTRNKISATWFLHVEAHESWLEHFHSFNNQEIALHCYEHGTSASLNKVYSNIQKGKTELEQAGYKISGLAAPYGIWNKALKQSLIKFNFLYTSEFTFAYDGVPLNPGKDNLPLQIPIHPICTGSLSRQRYSTKEMMDYFEQVFQNKLARFEPVIFYHHPLQPGLQVLEYIFKLANSHYLKNMTFADFADFWHKRKEFSFEAWFDEGKIKIEKYSNPDKLLQISVNHHQFDLINPSEDEVELTKTPKYQYSNPYLPEPEQIAQMRGRNLRLIKTSFLDWKNRSRL